MDNLWLNFRILSWHIKLGDPYWYSCRITYNPWHKEHNWCDGYWNFY